MLSINYQTQVIFVPQSFLTLVSGTLYELDLELFRRALKDLEDDADGMTFPDTHRHNSVVTLSGVSYAQTIEIINGYTVEFEDGQYSVRCVGANHNLADVKVPNSVSLIVGNSAGLITVETGGGTPLRASDIWNQPLAQGGSGTMGERMRAVLTVAKYLGLR